MSHNDFFIDVFEADSAPQSKIDAWHLGFTCAFHKTPHFFCRVDVDDVLGSNTSIAIASNKDAVVAGLHFTRHQREDSRSVEVKGLFNLSEMRGLSKLLIARAVEWEASVNPTLFSGIADVRVMPNGKVNAPSAAVLGDMGFVASDIARHLIQGTRRDRHLLASAEPDGTFACLVMCAPAHRLHRRTSSVLSKSSHSEGELCAN